MAKLHGGVGLSDEQMYEVYKIRKSEKQKDTNKYLLRKYGITLECKMRMLKKQGDRCKICQKYFVTPDYAHVDHCHTTGKVRGLLCVVCNTRLAWAEIHYKDIVAYLNGEEKSQ